MIRNVKACQVFMVANAPGVTAAACGAVAVTAASFRVGGIRNRYEDGRCRRPAEIEAVPAYGATIRDRGTGSTKCGQADVFHELRARVSSWPPLRLARLRRERGSVGV